jgi:hypothetical protein
LPLISAATTSDWCNTHAIKKSSTPSTEITQSVAANYDCAAREEHDVRGGRFNVVLEEVNEDTTAASE